MMHAKLFSISTILLLLISIAGCDEDQDPSIKQRASEDAKPSARHIPLDGQPNFRDIGGYKTSDGREVKWRQVFRSGEFSKLTEDDVRRLEGLQIQSVINFLTQPEIASHGEDRIPQGAEQIPLPMEAGTLGELADVILKATKTGDFSSVPPETNPDLHRFLMKEGRDYYAKFLRQVIDSDNRPVVYHCSHGIHRTGTATAILLSALGVPWEVIREDYLLSNECRKEEVEKRVQELRQLDAKNRGVPVEEVDPSNIEAFYVLEGSYIDAALEVAIEEFGSMDAYIREGLGITEDELQELKNHLLTE